MGRAIPDDLKRFLLTTSLTVPHVEAILQLRHSPPSTPWDADEMAARLYLRPELAGRLLGDLSAIGIARATNTEHECGHPVFVYEPKPGLAALLDTLERAYAENLVALSRWIHSIEDRNAQTFAAAFRFRKES
ncbi:MAG TPA: hypothetical protein VF132_00285 [Rudaea sp.]